MDHFLFEENSGDEALTFQTFWEEVARNSPVENSTTSEPAAYFPQPHATAAVGNAVHNTTPLVQPTNSVAAAPGLLSGTPGKLIEAPFGYTNTVASTQQPSVTAAKRQRNDNGAAATMYNSTSIAKKDSDMMSQTSSASKESKSTEYKDDPKAWLIKRRQQVARASKKARAKRKFEVMDLRKENERLKDERSEFLVKIHELEDKVVEMREEGTVDIQMENNLLRAQLDEHKKFLGSCLKLVNGIPKLTDIHKQMYRNGANYSMHHTLYLASRSLIETWKTAILPPQLSQATLNGMEIKNHVKICYKYTKGSAKKAALNLRIDVVLPGLDPAVATEVYWNSWNNPDLMKKLMNKEAFQLDALPTGDSEVGSNEPEIRAQYYQEHEESTDDSKRDWVFLTARVKQELAKSTLVLPLDRSPAVLSASSVTTGTSSRSKAKSAQASQVPEVGRVRCHVIARSTTQHVDDKACRPGARRITGMYTEGVIMWNERTFTDEPLEGCATPNINGKTTGSPKRSTSNDTSKSDKAAQSVPIARIVVLMTVSQDFKIKLINGMEDLIDSNGAVAPRLSELIMNYIGEVYAAGLSATAPAFA